MANNSIVLMIAENRSPFHLSRVIPGWVEGVQLMQQGSKYRFFIPWKLAYGPKGAGQDIPPYSVLIFEIELLSAGK